MLPNMNSTMLRVWDYAKMPTRLNTLIQTKRSLTKVQPEKNLAAELREPSVIRMVERSFPVPEENEILIKMGAVCLSSTDLILERYGRVGSNILKTPIIPGTCGCGIVIENPTNYTDLKPGDRVAIDTRLYCGVCIYCKADLHDNCRKGIMAGLPPKDGLLAQYFKHPAVMCYKLPEEVNMVKGSLCRMVASCLKAYDIGKISERKNVAIFGSGITGLTALVTAKAFGVGTVIITDRNWHHLEVAQNLGADYGLIHDHAPKQKDFVSINMELLKGSPEVTIDTIGTKESIEDACQLTSEYGIVVTMRIPLSVKFINFLNQQNKKIQIVSAEKCTEYFEKALNVIMDGTVNLDFTEVDQYPLAKSVEAFDQAHKIAYHKQKLIAIQCNQDVL